jgi:hypothetical protein
MNPLQPSDIHAPSIFVSLAALPHNGKVLAIQPVTIVEALITVLVVVVAALGLLGVGGYSKGTLPLLALMVCLA